MTRSILARAAFLAAGAALVVPSVASADIYDSSSLPNSVGINTMWVVFAGVLVMFM